ncbi:MAG TPA: hypothetical protein PLB04_15745, partial [Nitrospira sp.]|nr:hypothetical protein [Nitrospira sp.]
DRRILDTRLNQPRRRRMPEIVEVQVMHARARTQASIQRCLKLFASAYWEDTGPMRGVVPCKKKLASGESGTFSVQP